MINLEIEEFKKRLGIPSDDQSQDKILSIALEDGIEFAKSWCRNRFPDGLPGPVKRGIVKMFEIDNTITDGVVSESIGGMSQTFEDGDNKYASVFKLWKPYRKVGFK